MSDRLPVAIKCAPKWWHRAYEEKHAAAVTAAYNEFNCCDVYVRPWGIEVWTSVQCGKGDAAETVVRMHNRLNVAVEYAVADLAETFVDMK